MAGSSLSHILDPPRPSTGPALLATQSYPLHPPHLPVSSVPGITASNSANILRPTLHPPTSAPAVVGAPPTAATPSASLPPTNLPDSPSASTPGRGHTGPSLYACGDCGRRYSRPEHLQRHVQTHTLGRRFACQVCGKTFARADLKKRHETNHENDSSKKRRRTTTSPNAGRVAHACKACAVARVKCQEDKPCQRCVRRGLTCVSSEAGSTAAMHLVHLSANAHSTGTSSAESLEDSSPPAGYAPPSIPGSVPGSASLGAQLSVDQASPLDLTPSPRPDAGQMATPDTVIDQGLSNELDKMNTGNKATLDMDRLPFGDFLRDILYEQSFDNPDRLVEGQGLAVLDFCDDTNMELSDFDFNTLDTWNSDNTANLPTQQETPETDASIDISKMRQRVVKVWTDSPWRWQPNGTENMYGETKNLPVPSGEANMQVRETRKWLVHDKLEQSGRDRVLGLVLKACRQETIFNRVAASFPSCELVDTLIHIYLNSHVFQVSGWIHFPTFKLNEQWHEWIAAVAAAGAVLAPSLTLRKFGLALQESYRLTIPLRFEEDHRSIKDLGLLQSLILTQDIALWSGNRHKMEIAECHLVIPVTMMRYRGKYQRSSYPAIAVDPSDEGEVLQEKWKKWISQEQWKRLVLHAYHRDAQTSMTTLTNPAMSYSELTLPLPASKDLWFAKTAEEWKRLYLERDASEAKRAPSVGDLLHDIKLLAINRHRLDVQLALSVFLHAFWALILEYRSLSAAHRWRSYTQGPFGGPPLLLGPRHQHLVQDLHAFQMTTASWPEMSAQEHVVLNLLMMNLHVSLDDLQLFAGKEGEDQARRIYPVLQQWVESPDSRSAIWYAGQILRYAKMFPEGHLKAFFAVAVHHAALALWTYGVVTRANRREPRLLQQEPIYMDEAESPAVQKFINLGSGRTLIQGPRTHNRISEASIEDPRQCMEVAQEVLKANFAGGKEVVPAIVENLCGLIRQLGNAAWASPALVATTAALATVGLLAIARAALWPAHPNILPSPLKTGSGLPATTSNSSRASEALVYHPDLLPGSRDVDTPYGSIRVYEFGPETGEKVLFVHGISTPCVTLTPIANALVERGYRVMLFDLFGRGFSDGVADLPHDARLYVSQMLLVLASSPLPWTGTQTLRVIGYSLGGGIAVHFANTFPHLVKDLVLLAPAGLIRAESFGRVSMFLFKSGLVPERILAVATRRRLQQPIASSRTPKTPIADPVSPVINVVAAEAADPAPGEVVTPFESRVLEYVRWMVVNHLGFVPAFMSSIRHAPLTDQHESWAQIAKREPGTTAILLAESDEIIDLDDYHREALPLVGGEKNVRWRVLPGGHDFVMTHTNHILKELDEMWGIQS
ncbi:hypothetical protein EDB81DRAFT_837350 [Dactylonectria macrodidyma]|uniref:C6 and C2H2 transcription factor RegA-like protein n=1 Tax=Dactylonectria macrodidyma TaxID=307937 RepID=A0A9P9JLJ1_9HYPO|nr:hypothetical protein EDB81DRAFT_837350 [Dactylonectria macrodidyma]